MDADLEEIKRALGLMTVPGNVYELRAIGTHCGTVSGYFDDMNLMAKAAHLWSAKGPAVYFLPNPVDRELLARANNRAKEYTRVTSADADVSHRNWFLIDFDAVRKTGIPANEIERSAALKQAEACARFLVGQGFPRPLLADSGNGGHVCCRVDLPNDDLARTVLAGALKGIAARFDTAAATCDPTTHNAARVWKLYGTKSCKGDEYGDRLHRLARILEEPGDGVVTAQQLEALAALAPSPEPRRTATRAVSAPTGGSGRGDYSTLDVRAWFQSHGALGREHRSGMFTVDCPWKSEHTEQRPADDTDTVIYEQDGSPNAWPQFKCLHAHCRERGIEEVIQLWGDADQFCSEQWKADTKPPLVFSPKRKGLSEIQRQAEELDDQAHNLMRESQQPTITSLAPLRVVLTDPPTYYPTINGQEVEMSDAEYLFWPQFKRCVNNKLHLAPVLPYIPKADGKGGHPNQFVLDKLNREARETAAYFDAPSDAGEEGAAWEAVRSFLRQQETKPPKDETWEKSKYIEKVAEGKLVQWDDAFSFRGELLRGWLKSHQLDNLKAHDLWKVVRNHGGTPAVLRLEKKVVRCWKVPAGVLEDADPDAVTNVTPEEDGEVTFN